MSDEDLAEIARAHGQVGTYNRGHWLTLVRRHGLPAVLAACDEHWMDLRQAATGADVERLLAAAPAVSASRSQDDDEAEGGGMEAEEDEPPVAVPPPRPAVAPRQKIALVPVPTVSAAPVVPTPVPEDPPEHHLVTAGVTAEPALVAKVEEITPGRAAALLAKSRGNRPLRKQHIAWLAAQMAGGLWRLTHQAVALSVTDRLLDGHHRLEAVVLSGVTVRMLVIRGLPDECWDAIDCGVVRAVHDRIRLVDNPKTNRRHVEVMQTLLRVENRHRGRFTTEEVSRAWNACRGSLSAIMGIFPKPIPGVTRAAMLGALVRYHQRAGEPALAFARAMLEQGAGPPLARDLHDWLVNRVPILSGTELCQIVYWTTCRYCTANHKRVSFEVAGRVSGWW